MKIHHLLDPYVIHKLNKIRGPSPVQTSQTKEPAAKCKPGSFHLSERDVHELMGTKRQTYKRVGRRVKSK